MQQSISNDGWASAAYTVRNGSDNATTITVSGRERWALECLIAAGSRGCTPIDTPGPRWSAYVFDLRGRGLEIQTLNEPHGKPFAGSHARYVLVSRVTRLEGGEVAA